MAAKLEGKITGRRQAENDSSGNVRSSGEGYAGRRFALCPTRLYRAARSVGQPAEIAKAAVFLASGDTGFIAGIELFVDGGTVQV